MFTENTMNTRLFSWLSASKKPFRISANIPAIFQTTPRVTYTGAGVLPSGGSRRAEVGRRQPGPKIRLPEAIEPSELGLGDIVIKADFDLMKMQRRLPSVQLFASAKAPVANANDGFGTGEWDYGARLSLAHSIGGTFFFADIAYWVLGDTPGLELEDPLRSELPLDAYSPPAGIALLPA